MKTLFFAAMVSIAAMTSYGQTKANLSGNWKLNLNKTDHGGAPLFVLPQEFVITQDADKISMKRTIMTNENGDNQSYSEILPFNKTDAKTHVDFSNSDKLSHYSWSTDGQTFSIQSRAIMADGNENGKFEEIFTLADGGKTLVDTRRIIQENGLDFTIKIFYDKR